MRLVLPYPPSANRYWRKTAAGRVYVSEEAERYRAAAAALLAAFRPLSGPVTVSARFFRPRRSGDLDNRIKILLDALQGRAFADDSQVAEIHAWRFEDKHRPRVEVEIEEIDAARAFPV